LESRLLESVRVIVGKAEADILLKMGEQQEVSVGKVMDSLKFFQKEFLNNWKSLLDERLLK
jgi:hypothetical protein